LVIAEFAVAVSNQRPQLGDGPLHGLYLREYFPFRTRLREDYFV
jgi:hypothetical protein